MGKLHRSLWRCCFIVVHSWNSLRWVHSFSISSKWKNSQVHKTSAEFSSWNQVITICGFSEIFWLEFRRKMKLTQRINFEFQSKLYIFIFYMFIFSLKNGRRQFIRPNIIWTREKKKQRPVSNFYYIFGHVFLTFWWFPCIEMPARLEFFSKYFLLLSFDVPFFRVIFVIFLVKFRLWM